jgi:prepilin-type N-terminal cleavage/methylation domain-containing protein
MTVLLFIMTTIIRSLWMKKSIKMPERQANRQGFTLIELSVVLVIIGLLVGGILLGRDLIKAAELRGTVSQLERYQSAVYAFRVKYDALPGDMTSDTAMQLGFTGRLGTPGYGDGNGFIEGCSSGATIAGCETLLFWADLSSANLINGNFNQVAFPGGPVHLVLLEQDSRTMLDALFAYINPLSEAFAVGASFPKAQFLPKTYLGNGNYNLVFSASGYNYFEIAGVTGTTNPTGVYNLFNALTPYETMSMDQKIDDGLPTSGKVQAMEGTGTVNNAAVPGALTCVYNVGNPSLYNTSSSSLADSNLCQMRVQF